MSCSVNTVFQEHTKICILLDENNNIQTLKIKETLTPYTSSTDKKVTTKVVTFFNSTIDLAPSKKPIKELKEKLENLIKDNNEIGSDLAKLFKDKNSSEKKEFTIIFDKDGTKIQKKKTESTSTNKPIKPIKITGQEFLSKIDEIFSSFISYVPKLTRIRNLTASHNITQLKTTPNANKTVTKLLLTALTIGFLAGIIGIGAIMPHLGVASLTALGIPGIPPFIAIPLLAIGLATIFGFTGLKIASKSSDKAKNYLDSMFLLKSKLFLESNLNDFTNSVLLILMSLTMISAPWFATIQGCLAYPTGALLIASGLYQLGESITSMANNKKIGDIKELIISTLNSFSSGAVVAMGILTAIGMVNAPITIAITFIFGALMISVNSYNLYKSIKKLNEINKVDSNNETSIFEFLQKNLSLSEKETNDIKAKIKTMNETEILKWIEKNLKNFEKEQEQVFEQIITALKKAQEEERQRLIEEIKKLIINEERKNAIESKIERFGSIVNKETLIEVLERYASLESRLKTNDESAKRDLINLFNKIKKDTTGKTVAEIIKFAIINIPLMIIPSLQSMKIISTTLYNYFMATALLSNISINITPRYRNIPPAVIKRVLDINNELNNTTYAKYKEKTKITPISEGKDTTAKKTTSVAEGSIKLDETKTG